MIIEKFRKEFARHCMCSEMGGPKYLSQARRRRPPPPCPPRDSFRLWQVFSMRSVSGQCGNLVPRGIFHRVGRAMTPGPSSKVQSLSNFPQRVIRHQGEVTAEAVRTFKTGLPCEIIARPPLPSTRVIASFTRPRIHGCPHSLQAKARFATSFTVRKPTSSRSVIYSVSGSS